jgi:folate-binding protein YgfZ
VTASSDTLDFPGQELATLRIRGADALAFLQGQLSNDTRVLARDRLSYAGLHSPQGRVLALLRLAAPAPDDVIALLPAALAETTIATLRRFVLRARVSMAVQAASELAAELLVASAAPTAADHAPGRSAHARDVAAGLPQVYAATSGVFVAQMLNLDCIGAISFSKGCYTGQEVIARAHYRGKVKRRMQRFATATTLALPPGAALLLPDGRTALLVDRATQPDGSCEFLAVATLGAGAGSASDLAAEAEAAAPVSAATPAAPLVHCTPLPLPYALPE